MDRSRYWPPVILALALAGCVGNSKYHVEEITAKSNSSFEAVAHRHVLFYGNKELGNVGAYFISPSRRFALFESEGKLLLFDGLLGDKRDVTDGEFDVPKSVAWDKTTAYVTYYDKHKPTTIYLPR